MSVSRFLEMVWQYQIPTIVMLTRPIEDGKVTQFICRQILKYFSSFILWSNSNYSFLPPFLQVKCEQYWSDQLERTMTRGKFSVTLKSFVPSAEYQIRQLQLTCVRNHIVNVYAMNTGYVGDKLFCLLYIRWLSLL